MSSTAHSEALHHDPRLPLPIALRVHPRARRLKLRLDESGERLLLTCPPRSNRRAALDWAAGQRAWVEARLVEAEPAQPLSPGSVIPVEGRDRRLVWIDGGSRVVILSGELLSCGGSSETFARRIETWLRGYARRVLSSDTSEAAGKAGVTIRRVSIGDAGTRWGSCSESGSIRYNWRLILAPTHVRRWVVAHEVAHRVHMNHSSAFKALEAQLFDGDVAAARLLLRRIGPRLKRIGRSF
jgi:predicted metal-dependent hydrolase